MESTAPQLTVPEPADRGSDAMRVKNRKAVRRLSVRSFRAAGKRSVTAAVAIVLTTVLFTALFTIMMSINTSYESYTFRQDRQTENRDRPRPSAYFVSMSPVIFIAAALFSIVTVFISCSRPARMASKVSPLVTGQPRFGALRLISEIVRLSDDEIGTGLIAEVFFHVETADESAQY